MATSASIWTYIIKVQNEKTRKIAEQIKAERVLALQSHGIGNWNTIKRASMPLNHWLMEYEGMTLGVKKSTLNGRRKMRTKVCAFLEESNRTTIALDEVDRDFCRELIKWLMETPDQRYSNTKDNTSRVSVNTVHDYLDIFSSAMNKAVKEELIPANPVKSLDAKERPQPKEGSKEYLTIDEIKKMADTPCGSPVVKTAFLFACFTGLRISDIRKLANKDILLSSDGKTRFIYTEMVKTGGTVTVPLSAEALKWLPTSEEDNKPLFCLPKDPSTVGYHLNRWVDAAGVTKHITFHCARHTFGTLMLTLGADIYTTSKLMGHSNVKITETYAKIVDQKRVDAINLMDNMFG